MQNCGREVISGNRKSFSAEVKLKSGNFINLKLNGRSLLKTCSNLLSFYNLQSRHLIRAPFAGKDYLLLETSPRPQFCIQHSAFCIFIATTILHSALCIFSNQVFSAVCIKKVHFIPVYIKGYFITRLFVAYMWYFCREQCILIFNIDVSLTA